MCALVFGNQRESSVEGTKRQACTELAHVFLYNGRSQQAATHITEYAHACGETKKALHTARNSQNL